MERGIYRNKKAGKHSFSGFFISVENINPQFFY